MDAIGRLATAAAVVVALTMSAAALAAESPTRDEYVSGLERICKPDVEATERAMKGVRDDIDAGRTSVAAGKFAKATRIFAGTNRAMAAAPRPVADEARLEKWFVYLGRQRDYLARITAQLRVGHTIKAQRLTARFIHNGNLANNVVLAFGFDHCTFRFSRFG